MHATAKLNVYITSAVDYARGTDNQVASILAADARKAFDAGDYVKADRLLNQAQDAIDAVASVRLS